MQRVSSFAPAQRRAGAKVSMTRLKGIDSVTRDASRWLIAFKGTRESLIHLDVRRTLSSFSGRVGACLEGAGIGPFETEGEACRPTKMPQMFPAHRGAIALPNVYVKERDRRECSE